MPRPSNTHRGVQDMYWFAHGGIEPSTNEHSNTRENTPCPGDTEDESSEGGSLSCKPNQDRLANTDESALSPNAKQGSVDRQDSAGRISSTNKRLAVEERKRQILEAEQEKNEAILKKHAEREAALEARRNAQRSNISFAFGTSLPPNAEFDIAPVQLQPSVHSFHSKAANNNVMTQSMTTSMVSTRGRRKNDLTPTIPYDRTGASARTTSGPVRKRSVSMSRLDALAQPRKHYVEAQKAGSTMSNSSARKDGCQSPKRPLSSASEKSNKSNRAAPASTVTRRPHGTASKPRPVTIAGSVPDEKSYARTSAPLRKSLPPKKQDDTNAGKTVEMKSSNTKHQSSPGPQKLAATKQKPAPVAKASPSKPAAAKSSASPKPKTQSPKSSSPKPSPLKKLPTNKKQATKPPVVAVEDHAEKAAEIPKKLDDSANADPGEDSQLVEEKSIAKQHIVSEEEAKAALAEKRRLAREQAEKEALIQKLHQEELERERERQLRLEEEKQRLLEEEQLRLLEEHRKFEEEKLQKAIEAQEKKDEEEKAKQEEEARFKAEQERKAKEEAEKQRIELEEKLRKEEEERAERKKRLEKIMSRTRGKSGTASPSGSYNGSDPPDSMENQPFSSEPSSLESNEQLQTVEHSSPNESLETNQNPYLASQSLSSNDLMIPSSGQTSLDGGSLQAVLSEPTSLDSQKDVFIVSEENQLESTYSTECDVKSDSIEVIQDESQASAPSTVLMEESVVVTATPSDNQSVTIHEEHELITDQKEGLIEAEESILMNSATVTESTTGQNEDKTLDAVKDLDGIKTDHYDLLTDSDIPDESNVDNMLLNQDCAQLVDSHLVGNTAESEQKLEVPEHLALAMKKEVDAEDLSHPKESEFAEVFHKESSLSDGLQNHASDLEFCTPSEISSDKVLTSDIHESQNLEKEIAFKADDYCESAHGEDTEEKRLGNSGFTDFKFSSDVVDQANQMLASTYVGDLQHTQSISHEIHPFSEDTKEFTAILSEDKKCTSPVPIDGGTFVEDKSHNPDDKPEKDGLMLYSFYGTEVPCETVAQAEVLHTNVPVVQDFQNDIFGVDYAFSSENVSSNNPFSQEAVNIPISFPVDAVTNSNKISDVINLDIAPTVTSTGNSSALDISTDFVSASTDLVSDSINVLPGNGCDQSSRTQNPFGSGVIGNAVDSGSVFLPTNNGLSGASDFIVEESDDSSLDSNLSQVLNVNTSNVICHETSATECLPNGQAYSVGGHHEQNNLCDMQEVPKSNGCNGSTCDGRPQSVDFKADHLSGSSEMLQFLADNGSIENKDIFCFSDKSTVNSSKVSSNPFLGVSEANPFANNPF